MPTVPVIDQTAMGAQPFASPNVAPLRDSAPQQQEAMGQAAQRAGELATRTGQAMGDRIADIIDETQTRKAESAYLTSGTAVVRGYLQTRNADAVQGYGDATKNLAQARVDARASLDNEIQRQLFDLHTQDHSVTLGTQMADHQHAQYVGYASAGLDARADSMNQLAVMNRNSRNDKDADGNPTGLYQRYAKQSDDQVRQKALLMGLAPDDEQTAAMVRANRTDRVRGVVASLIDEHRSKEANETLTGERDTIDERAFLQMSSQLRPILERDHVVEAGDKYIALGSTGGAAARLFAPSLPVQGGSLALRPDQMMGAPREGGRQHDGIDIPAAVGTDVVAPTGGKIVGVFNDTEHGGGLTVRVQSPNGYTFGMAHLSAVGVKVGDTVSQNDPIAKSGQSGNATAPLVHYAVKAPDGTWVDPTKLGVVPQLAGRQPDLAEQEERAIQSATEGEEDPSTRRDVINYVRQHFVTQRQIQNQEVADNYKSAQDSFFKGGSNWTAIPAATWGKLTPEQQHQFKVEQQSEIERQYNFGQFLKNASETNLVSHFIQHPEDLTPDAVNQNAPNLSHSTYISLMKQAVEYQGSPEKVRAATVDASRLRFFVNQSGLPAFGPDSRTPDAQARFNELHQAVQDVIAQEQATKKRALTPDEKDAIMKRELTQQTLSTPRSRWNPMYYLQGVSGGGPLATEQKYTFEMPSTQSAEQWGRDSAGNPVRIK